MKRNIIFAILLIVLCSAKLWAQTDAENDKRRWGSMGLSVNQLMMLNDWFDDPQMRDYIGRYPYPHIQANFNIRVYKEFGFFFNLGVGKAKRNEIPNDYNPHSSIDLNNFYREVIFYQHPNKKVIVHGDMGIYHKFFYKKWIFVPYFGVKMMDYQPAMLSYTLKGKGNNEKYIMDYGWGADRNFRDDRGSNSLSFKFKTERKLSKDFNLDFGVEFNVLMSDVYYRERITDFYTQEVIHSRTIRANRLSSVGLILGVNFR